MKIFKAYPIYYSEKGHEVYNGVYEIERDYYQKNMLRLFFTDESKVIDYLTKKEVYYGCLWPDYDVTCYFNGPINNEEWGIVKPTLLYDGEYSEEMLIKLNEELEEENYNILTNKNQKTKVKRK